MTTGGSRQPDPDKAYTACIEYGEIRRRTELGLSLGDVTWFMVQLEYNHNRIDRDCSDWRHVARFDHHPQWDWGHDIEKEGLHLDIFDTEQRKVMMKRGFEEVPINEAPAYCETFLEKRAAILTQKYKER
jgi:hypothetical protein